MCPRPFFVQPELTFWEKVGTRIRQALAFLKHAKDNLLAGPLSAMVKHMKIWVSMWPRACTIHIDTYQSKVHEFTASPTLPLGKWLLQVTCKILQAKMSEVASASNDRYAAFVAKACTANGASLGHTLVDLGQGHHCQLPAG